MSITATVFESLKRVSENVTRVYQSGFAHGFAEIEKVVMDDVEVGLDNIIAIQEELIGTITFTFNGVTYSALRGMTWAEWCDSKYNTIGLYIGDDGTVLTPNGNTIGTANYDYVDITGDMVIIEGETYMEI